MNDDFNLLLVIIFLLTGLLIIPSPQSDSPWLCTASSFSLVKRMDIDGDVFHLEAVLRWHCWLDHVAARHHAKVQLVIVNNVVDVVAEQIKFILLQHKKHFDSAVTPWFYVVFHIGDVLIDQLIESIDHASRSGHWQFDITLSIIWRKAIGRLTTFQHR